MYEEFSDILAPTSWMSKELIQWTTFFGDPVLCRLKIQMASFAAGQAKKEFLDFNSYIVARV
jgi:hypothetical protein